MIYVGRVQQKITTTLQNDFLSVIPSLGSMYILFLHQKKKKPEKKSRRNLGTWLFFKEILKAIGRHKDCLQGAGEVGVTFLQCIVHLPALVQCRFPLEFPGGCWHAGRAAAA